MQDLLQGLFGTSQLRPLCTVQGYLTFAVAPPPTSAFTFPRSMVGGSNLLGRKVTVLPKQQSTCAVRGTESEAKYNKRTLFRFGNDAFTFCVWVCLFPARLTKSID